MAATVTPTSDLSTALGSNPHIERLYDNVQAVVPAVTLAGIKLAAWNTIEEFFIRSTVKREHVFWQLGASVQTIDFNPFDANWLVAWVLDYTGLPCGYGKIEPPSVLRDLTYPVPTTQRKGEAILALKPVSFDAVNCGCMDDLWSTWFEAILDGTLFRLYGQPAKPYSNQQLAVYHGNSYRRHIASARAIASRGFGNTPRWSFPYFAAGKRKQ